jgi:hypothetical protein
VFIDPDQDLFAPLIKREKWIWQNKGVKS